jgi:hypothetical protein
MVRTVSNPSDIRAGIASIFNQNDTQDRKTIRKLGIYIWTRVERRRQASMSDVRKVKDSDLNGEPTKVIHLYHYY